MFVYVYSGIQHVSTICVIWQVSFRKQELQFAYTWVHLRLGGIRVAYLFCFLRCVFLLFGLHHVTCVTNVDSVSELSFIDCSFFVVLGSSKRSFIYVLGAYI